MKLIRMEDLPELEGWYSLPVAADKLGVERQRLYQMVQEGKIKTARRIPGISVRPAAYVVRTAEINKLIKTKLMAEATAAVSEGRETAASPG